jgi:predicted TIM-barrel fold metal-dependent hydrolase
MASTGPGYVDPQGHSVIEVLAEAVAKKDRRTRNLWFEVSSNAHPENPAEISDLLVKLIRKIGVNRILYGTDGAAGGNLHPRENWEAFRQLKLTEKEIKTIAKNVAPYLR